GTETGFLLILISAQGRDKSVGHRSSPTSPPMPAQVLSERAFYALNVLSISCARGCVAGKNSCHPRSIAYSHTPAGNGRTAPGRRATGRAPRRSDSARYATD